MGKVADGRVDERAHVTKSGVEQQSSARAAAHAVVKRRIVAKPVPEAPLRATDYGEPVMSQTFVADGAEPEQLLAAYQPLLQQNVRAIRDSWRRCRSAGLGCDERPRVRRVSARRLERLYAATADVRSLALAEMRLLHDQLGARGFTLTLADPDSVILDCLPSDDHSVSSAGELAPGYCWLEDTHGTNAVGTAAAAGRVVVVAGADHYLETYRGLVCIATPIFGADGELRAIIDATAETAVDSHALAYTLGLMQMAGGHVQTELFRQRHHDAHVVMLDMKAGPATQSAIALAFEPDGRLRATSAGARQLFAHALMVPGTDFSALFRQSLDTLVDTIRPPAGFVELVDHDGHWLTATLYLCQSPAPADSPAAAAGQARYIADDADIKAALELAGRASRYRVPVLIEGETGTGKEQAARHVHSASQRVGEFVAVNCAGLPAELIEAELFGHAPGAYTGARAEGGRGLVRQADGGTLFLDEIGDMPHRLQAHLLRLIDTWDVRPVGSDVSQTVDVQLVTATHRDLDAAVEAGSFRADLLHRIRVARVSLAPLRARSDCRAIAQALLAGVDDSKTLSADALAALAAHDWPGNIRELRNVITQLVLATPAQTIPADAVHACLHSCAPCGAPGSRATARQAIGDDDVREAVAAEAGNIAAAARRLGVSRTTVYKHLSATP
tara:strand:+ start:7626 stop:9647 length:2022 start_codon:yes stop_codon:yes gene_type:complete